MSSSVGTLLIVIALWLGLALSCGGSSSREPAKVTYDVVGEGTRSASLTYQNGEGGTEQRDVKLPWTSSFTARPGSFLYISAQNKNDSGSITVYISINGNTRKTSTSSGAYVIASANYRCCD